MNKKIVTLLKMILLSLGMIAVAIAANKKSGHNVDTGDAAGTTSHYFAMGTSVTVNIYAGEKNVDAEAIKEQLVADIKSLDKQLLSWRSADSEIGRLNSNIAESEEVRTQISEELYVVLKQSLDICSASEGALDITIRPLAMLWNIEGDGGNDNALDNVPDNAYSNVSNDVTSNVANAEFVPPTSKEINAALEKVDYQAIALLSEASDNTTDANDSQSMSLDDTNNASDSQSMNSSELSNSYKAVNYYVSSSSKDIVIDLGATGKGYALDKAKAVLDDAKVEGALVTVGGSILVYGEKADGSSFKVGVRDPLKPDDTNAMIGYLEFAPGTVTCVSTSGGYEKFKTYEGKDYHHILDSKTGYPSDSGLLSVTVVCDNGLVSDGLSTACFVLGYERSLPLLEKYNAEAVFMDSNGDIMVTDGLKDCWIEQ